MRSILLLEGLKYTLRWCIAMSFASGFTSEV